MRKINRIIYNASGLSALVRMTKKISPVGFEDASIYDVVKYLRAGHTFENLLERTAAISYNFIMSIPPSLLFFFSLFPHLPFISRINLKHQLHVFILNLIPSKTYNEGIIEFIDNYMDGNKLGILSFGFLFALFFASNSMMGVMRSFNKQYIGFMPIKGISKRLRAIKLTFIIYGLALLYLIVLVMQGNVLNWLVKDPAIKHIINNFRWILLILLLFSIIAVILKYAPPTQKKWNFVSPGSIFATIMCMIATSVFVYFVSNFGRYNALYGTIGTIMMVMALIFINSLMMLIGFELNVAIKSLKHKSLQEKISKSIDPSIEK